MQRFCSLILFLFLFITSFLWWSPPLLALSATTARLAQATFAITTTTPDGLSIAPLTTQIQATFTADLDMTTVNGQSFVVQSSVRGRLAGVFGYDNGTRRLTFTPTLSLLQGEVISVIASNAIKSTTAAILIPYQWRFTAGHIEQRCLEGFIPYEKDFTSVWTSTAAWGDYDNDNDLDVLVTGQTSGSRVTFIYRNNSGNSFSRFDIGVPGVREGSIAWGDYDNDSDLDILIAGESIAGQITQIYRNNGNTSFSNTNLIFLGIGLGEASWSDYNNDGYLDVLVVGQNNITPIARLYRNNRQGGFTEISVPFVGVNNGATDWADYDSDGDLDLLLTGDAGVAMSILYRNDGNDTFVNANVNLTGVRDGAVAWGDYDNDGDEDILLTGNTSNAAFTAVSIVYRNNGNGTFTNSNAGLIGVSDGAVAWGDYDNDGDSDILLSGKNVSEESTIHIYANQSGAFVEQPYTLPAVSLGSIAWGDYDRDLDLDILLTGLADVRIVTGVYQNFDCPSDVGIRKSVIPESILTSQPVTFTITFSNTGPVTATRVIITDIIPSALTNVKVVSSTNMAGVTIVDNGANPRFGWNVSNLPVNAGGTIIVTGDLTPEPGAVYINTTEIAAARDITLSNNIATASIIAPFRILQTVPQGGGVTALPTGPIQATFEANVDPTTVTGNTLRAVGSQSGYFGPVNTSYDDNSRSYSFYTNRAWKVGETISAIGTNGINSADGAPLLPYQWQFVVGWTSIRCVGEFTDMPTGLPAVTNGTVAWGDYDQDGDLDLSLSGQVAAGRITRIYRNDNGNWINLNAPLTAVGDGAAAWGDYDGDGDLDLLLTGHSGANPLTNLYRNDGGTFIAINPALPPVSQSAVAWGDYDNDGNLDLVLAGNSGTGRITRIYRNNGLSFTNTNVALPGMTDGTVAWGDYDKDGDLDLLLTGTGDSGRLTAIYTNNNGVFTNNNAGLILVDNSTAAWGDYDKDNDLDLLISGNTGAARAIQLYRNDGGVFTATNPALPAVDNGSVAWGDYDNDGSLDLLLSGASDSGQIAGIYRQVGGLFTDFGAGLTGVSASTATWGDYDRDGDVDLALIGSSTTGPLTTLRRNTNCISDTRVTKRVKPAVAVAGDIITYTLAFSNTGPQPALGVVITDLLPVDITNVQIISTTVGAGVKITDTNAATGKVWRVSNLAVGQGGMITMTAMVLPGTPGTVFLNTALITSTHDITLTNNSGGAMIGRPYHVTATVPSSPTLVSIPLAAPLQATFDADVDASTAVVQNLAVYGQQSGLRTGAMNYNAINRTLSFTPTTPLHHGEPVDVVGLATLLSRDGAPLTPYQWHFVAGRYVDERCIAEFKPLATALPALSRSDMTWGDYDKDGDLDVAVIGLSDGANRQSKIYRNDGNAIFSDIGVALTAVTDGAVSWGDYDKDGDPDLLLTGSSQAGPTTRLYRNDNGIFSEVATSLPGVANSSVAWGDYDNDGDLDLALAGTADGTNGATLIYRNEGNGSFSNRNAVLTGVHRGKVAWGDYDSDGDPDLLLMGTTNGIVAMTQLYRNDKGSFTNLNLGFPGLYDSDADWGDYDNDGDLDLVLMGTSDGTSRSTLLIRNDGGNLFSVIPTTLPALSQGSVAWGDYENDGDLDLLLTGTTNGTTPTSRVFINQGLLGFSDVTLPIVNLFNSAATWHDYDGDADLDLLLLGGGASGAVGQLYRSIDCISDLTLNKSVSPASVLPGELVTYTLSFSNIGPQPATRIALTDLLPLDKLSDVQIHSTLPITQVGETPYSWLLPNLPFGTGGRIDIIGRTTFAATGLVFTNTATIHAREDLTPTNDISVVPLIVRAPQASFVTTATIDEQSGQATITVLLDAPNLAGAVTVAYEFTTQGTAQPGSDYSANNGIVTIPAGQTSATFTVPIQEDALDEEDETVILTLSNPVGAVLGAITSTTLTIIDNDAAPILSIANATASENAGTMVFTLTLSGPSGRTVSITASTLDDTAIAPIDYMAIYNLLITIPPGQTMAQITVQLVDNHFNESNKQFFLTLTSPVNVTFLANQTIGMITENDIYIQFLSQTRR